MKKNNALFIISGVLTATVLYLTKKAKNDSYVWYQKECACHRSGDDKKAYEDFYKLNEEGEKIRKKEKIEIARMKASTQKSYNDILEKTRQIERREELIIAEENISLNEKRNTLAAKLSAIEAREENMLRDICKNDDTLQALKTARKALKTAEKPTSEIDEKISMRKNVLKTQIYQSRSEEDNTVEKELARVRLNISNERSRIDALVKNRSDEEKSLFTQRDNLYQELYLDGNREAIVMRNRSNEEKDILDAEAKAVGKCLAVKDKEIAEYVSNENVHFGRYLHDEVGLNSVSVFCIGMIPLIPVLLVVRKYVKYILTLSKNTKGER